MSKGTALQPVWHYLKAAVGSETAGVSDGDLLQRFASHRDDTAFELLVWRHVAMVQHVCRGVLRDQHLAEDATQATFLILAKKADTIRCRDAVAGWLHRVAYRIAVSLARKAPIATQPLVEVPLAQGGSCNDADTLATIHAEIARLPDRYRLAVVLCCVEGLSQSEVAHRLQWPLGTVAGRLARAKVLLQRRLTQRGIGLSVTAFAAGLAYDQPSAMAQLQVSQLAQAARAFACKHRHVPHVSSTTITIAQGAIKTMKQTKLVLGLAFVLWASGLMTTTYLVAQGTTPAPKEAPKVVEVPPVKKELPLADYKQRVLSRHNLRMLALAVLNHHDAVGYFPRDITDKKGNPLLSWRVALLPYIEQNNLYNTFKLDEPWDSEHNARIGKARVKVFMNGHEAKDSAETFYHFYQGEGAILDPKTAVKVADVRDGTSNTIGIVEAGPAVPWTKPGGLPFDAKKPLPQRVGPFSNVFHTAMMDGSVASWKSEIDDDFLRLLIMRADDTVLDDKKREDFRAKFPPLTEAERQLYDDAQQSLKDLAKTMMQRLEEKVKLDLELRTLSNTDLSDMDRLFDQIEDLKEQIRKLEAENQRAKRTIEALKKK